MKTFQLSVAASLVAMAFSATAADLDYTKIELTEQTANQMIGLYYANTDANDAIQSEEGFNIAYTGTSATDKEQVQAVRYNGGKASFTTGKTFATNLVTESAKYTMGLRARGTDMTVDASDISINVKGKVGEVSGLMIQSGKDTNLPSTLGMNAKNVSIVASVDNGIAATAVATFGSSKTTIEAENITLKATKNGQLGNAIATRNAEKEVPSQTIIKGTGKTVIEGHVAFDAHKTGSSAVDASVEISMTGADSYWKGNTVANWGEGCEKFDPADFTFDNGLKLTLANGATWYANDLGSVVEGADFTKEGSSYIGTNTVTLNSGVVKFEKAGQVIKVDKLEGTGGTIYTPVTLNTKARAETPVYVVGDLQATNNSLQSVNVVADGLDGDDYAKLSDDEQKALQQALGGVAQDKNGSTTSTIQAGDVKGATTTVIDNDGQIVSTTTSENPMQMGLSAIRALSALNMRHEMSSLTKRMGELRDAPAGYGAWARVYGSEMEYGDYDVKSENVTLQVGADTRMGDWVVGMAANYTDGEGKFASGQSDAQSYGFGVYGTYFAPCGAYIDLVGKYVRLENELDIGNMDNTLKNNAFAVSAETGYRFNFVNNAVFVEPQVGLSYARIMGDKSTSATGITVDEDDTNSLIGRVGVRAGYHFSDKGMVYGRVSGLYEFQGDMDYKASKDGVSDTFKEDLEGAWVEMAIGANYKLTDRTYTYVDVERTAGGDVDENYRFNIGVRHVW